MRLRSGGGTRPRGSNLGLARGGCSSSPSTCGVSRGDGARSQCLRARLPGTRGAGGASGRPGLASRGDPSDDAGNVVRHCRPLPLSQRLS
ncbi:hypothetical protein T484DRAFT_2988508 [Baffinella frigidus]|nr:hypothetical protein T484DRAFT_2988508 [Cryptophyta sp. CCMP2293]